MRLFSLVAAAVGMMTVARAIPTKRHGGEAQQPFAIADKDTTLNVLEAAQDQFDIETDDFLELWDDEGLVKRIVAKSKVPHTKPLGSVSDLSRCPSGLMACPIMPMSFLQSLEDFDADYECVDPSQDLFSCGGCITLGAGQDCNATPGVLSSACSYGSCIALSCEAGWELDIRSSECKRKRPHKHHDQEALDY